jgi:hypothetical protein
MIVQPSFAFSLQVGKVHDSADGILRVARYEKIGDIVMAVKIFAFAAVLVQTVSSAELNPTHDRQAHNKVSF